MPKRRSVSDVLMSTPMSTCGVPFSVVKLFLGRWIFGECFCLFHGFDVFTFGLASLYSMGIIEISRYLCVVKDMLCYLNKKDYDIHCRRGAALLGSLPPFFFKNGGFEFQPGKASKVPVHFSNQYCVHGFY